MGIGDLINKLIKNNKNIYFYFIKCKIIIIKYN